MNMLIDLLIDNLSETEMKMALNECTQEDVQTLRYAKVVIAELQGKLDNLSSKLSNEYSDRGWVLCTEKLPEHSGAYLSTVRSLEDNYLWSEELIYYHETNSWFWREEPELFEVDNERFEIVAWQWLPDPYSTNRRK